MSEAGSGPDYDPAQEQERQREAMIDRILQRFARAEQTGAPPLSSYAPEVLIGAGFDLGWATGVKELVRLQAADGVQLPMALAVALQEHLAYALLRARREAKEAK